MSEDVPRLVDSNEWLSSFQAVKRFREAGGADPMALAHWAEDGLLRTRAGWCRIDEEDDEFEVRDVPAYFWRWVNVGEDASANWDAGAFSATVWYGPYKAEESRYGYWRLSAVTFYAEDLARLLCLPGACQTPLSLPPTEAQINPRGAGAKPNAAQWAEFAAALARVMSYAPSKTTDSRTATYQAVEHFLTTKQNRMMDEKTVRRAIDLALKWCGEE